MTNALQTCQKIVKVNWNWNWNWNRKIVNV